MGLRDKQLVEHEFLLAENLAERSLVALRKIQHANFAAVSRDIVDNLARHRLT